MYDKDSFAMYEYPSSLKNIFVLVRSKDWIIYLYLIVRKKGMKVLSFGQICIRTRVDHSTNFFPRKLDASSKPLHRDNYRKVSNLRMQQWD